VSRDHRPYQRSGQRPERAHIVSRGYELWAEDVATKVRTLLGLIAHDASPLRLTGVTLADGTYDVLVYLEGYLWTDVRLVDVLRVTVSGGAVSAGLPPPVEDLGYSQVGDYTRLTWTWATRFGCLAPDSFGIWASTSAPPSTAGAPDVTVLAESPRRYAGVHEQGASATYYAVAALTGATRGPESRLGPVAAAGALSGPAVQFADDESLG